MKISTLLKRLRPGGQEAGEPLRPEAFEDQASAASAGSPTPELRVPRRLLLGLLALALIAVGWAFYMGLIIGRGQNPSQSVPALGQIFERAEGAPESVETGEEQAAAPAGEPDPAAAVGDEGPALAETAPAAPPAPVPASPQASSPRRQRLYQIAAFRSREEAQALAQRLKLPGMKAQVRQAGKVWTVTASGRLNAEEEAVMRERLAEMRLGAPLLLGSGQSGARNRAEKAARGARTAPASRPQAKAAAGARPKAAPGKAGAAPARKAGSR